MTTYKERLWTWHWLRAALNKERKKYAASPVEPDLMPDYENTQGWGYIVAGYFLIEQGLKAVLSVRGTTPQNTHDLSLLFAALPAGDQDQLREYYDDLRQACPRVSGFPISTLDDFLANLDGKQDQGHMDWRYFLTQEGSGAPLPTVSIDLIHEIIEGCVALVHSTGRVGARSMTYSWRLRRERAKHQREWQMRRLNSSDWREDGDRIELLWGPDYRGRYDYLVCEGDGIFSVFGPLPNGEGTELVILDKRAELERFDPDDEPSA